ncbi:hypothetical protein RJT34_27645 [Clitoria ternatea]|uniref:Uncharacterized protein n=1 Tax=Clitoria ternatea TaxID=43366 RepID=A0AAN9F827_CLITE
MPALVSKRPPPHFIIGVPVPAYKRPLSAKEGKHLRLREAHRRMDARSGVCARDIKGLAKELAYVLSHSEARANSPEHNKETSVPTPRLAWRRAKGRVKQSQHKEK